MVYAWIIPISIVAILGISGYLVYRFVIFDILANSSVNSTLKRYNIKKTQFEIIKEFNENKGENLSDAKLRTFITQDSSRDDLVAHVYDITYGIVKKTDNLVIIDDSIVRGTTLEKSILRMLDRLEPKKIIIVSSAPQIRYPDCYGIDMAKLDQFIAFKACIELHKQQGTYDSVVKEIYNKCVNGFKENISEKKNNVKDFYRPFSHKQISRKIAEILKSNKINAELDVIFQEINGLHKACPDNLGDWYFTGNYPTPGGNRVVNRAFINFYEGKSKRAY